MAISLWLVFQVSFKVRRRITAIIFLISILAETNRAPFDLPEAEAELVAGYNVEYSSIVFALFFLGEYSNILLMSSVFVILFLGGWSFFFGLIPEIIFSFKVVVVICGFIFIRANIPRYRFDQLMTLCWKGFLPVNLGVIIFISGSLLSVNSLPLQRYSLKVWYHNPFI